MPDYDLGTARGRIDIDGDGAVTGFGKADAAQTKFSRGAKVAGGIIAGAGVGIAAGLGLAINSAANFEERMSAVEAVSGATGKQLDDLREKALQLGADTKFSATEAAGAIEELVKAGIPVEDVLNGAADAAVNLAAAGEIELAEAATIAANALNVFNLRGEDMEHVADLIAGAANASAIDVSEFGLSLQQAGATANLVGLSFDDLTLAIAAMGNAGIKGSDAGTSLKTFLANLQPTTEKQISLFKELGLLTEETGNAFFDAQGKIKPMREIAETLSTALAGMTEQQKALALETLFGSDAIRAAAIIAGEGAAGFDELATSIGKVSAEEVAETRMDNLRGSIEQLKGSVETLAIRFGTPLLNAVRGVVDFITMLANKFSELSPGVQKTIGIILAVVAAFLTLGGIILLVVGWFGTVATAVGLSIGALASVIGIAFAVIAVIALLVAGLVLLYKENETFRNIVQGVWNWIKDTIPPIIDTIVTGIQALIAAFKDPDVTSDGFVGVMERIGVAARAVWDWITGTLIPAFQEFISFLVDDAAPAVADFASTIMDGLAAAWEWIDANVMPVVRAFGELVVAVFNRVVDKVDALIKGFEAIWPVVKFVFELIWNIIKTNVVVIMALWGRFGDNIIDIVMTAFNAIKGIVQGALQVLQGIIQVVTGIISGDWGKAWEGIKNIFGGVWDIMFNIVKFAVENIINAVRLAWDIVSAIFVEVWDFIKGILQAAWDFIWNIVSTYLAMIAAQWEAVWNAVLAVVQWIWENIVQRVISGIQTVIDWISGIQGRVLGVLWNIGSWLVQAGSDLVGGLVNGIAAVISWVTDAVTSISQRIRDFFSGAGAWLYQTGKNIIQGLVDGIKDKIEDAVSAVKSAGAGIKAGIENVLHIGSPSKVMITIGKQIMEGLSRGIAATTGKVLNQMGRAADDLVDQMSGKDLFEAGGGFDSRESLGRLLEALAGSQASSVPMITPAPPAAPGNTPTTVNFNFPNVKSAEDAAAIEEALSSSDVMRTLLDTLRAGRRVS